MKPKKVNRIQGFNLYHEEIASKIDHIEFWKSSSEENYLNSKYVSMNKPSATTTGTYRKNRKAIPCKISREELFSEYEKHKKIMKDKFPESDGRLCRYCEKRVTFMIGYKNTNISVDRINNNKDYEIGNIIFCCGKCNDTKNQVTLDLCKNILRVASEVE